MSGALDIIVWLPENAKGRVSFAGDVPDGIALTCMLPIVRWARTFARSLLRAEAAAQPSAFRDTDPDRQQDAS